MKAVAKRPKTRLTVEWAGEELWGQVKVKGNLIVDSAKTLEALKKKLKKLVLDFEAVAVEEFEVRYDLASFFETYSYLTIPDVAKSAGINPALMRHYASGVKLPSEERVRRIEQAIHETGRQLTRVRLHQLQKKVT